MISLTGSVILFLFLYNVLIQKETFFKIEIPLDIAYM